MPSKHYIILFLMMLSTHNIKSFHWIDKNTENELDNFLMELSSNDYDMDSFLHYPQSFRPMLSINSTLNEDEDFMLSHSEDNDIPYTIEVKRKMFKEMLTSKELHEHFDEFVFGLLSSWFDTARLFQTLIRTQKWIKEECGIEAMWNKYKSSIYPKQKKIIHILINLIPDDIPANQKEEKCNLVIKEELKRLDLKYKERKTLVKNLRNDIDELRTIYPDAIDNAGKLLLIHDKAMKSYEKEIKHLNMINCKKISEDPDLSIKYSIMKIADYLKDFLSECSRCYSKIPIIKQNTVLSPMFEDLGYYINKASSKGSNISITGGMYEGTKSLFHVVRLRRALSLMLGSLNNKEWSKYSYEYGKSLGLSIRIITVSLKREVNVK